jgi:predicted ATP-dependent endonuclease of OLD family
MRLKEFRVQKFRNILDSNPIAVEEGTTCFVGKNESGKTALLQALYRAKPAYGASFDVDEDYPRWLLVRDRKSGVAEEAQPIQVVFVIEDEDRAAAEEVFGPGVLISTEVAWAIGYDDTRYFDLEIDESAAVANLLATLALRSPTATRLRSSKSVAALSEALEDWREELQETPKSADTSTTLAEIATVDQELRKAFDGHTPDYIVSELLWSRVPTFFYFSDYSTLPGRVDLRQLARAKSSRPGVDSLQTARALLEMAGTDVESLMSDDYEQRKAELDAVSNELTRDVLEYWTQNPDLRVDIDIDKEDSSSGTGSRSNYFLDIRVRDGRHGYTTNFGQRSSGFQWFFSFLAAFSEFEGMEHGVVILLDEPGTSLHGRAQSGFLRFIEERLVPTGQVIYTTHSPFLVDPNHVERVRLVTDEDSEQGVKVTTDVLAVDHDTLFPVQAAIGYDLAAHLFVGADTLVVQGISDYMFLSAISERLLEKGRTGLDDRFTVLPIGDLEGLPAFVALLGHDLDVTVLSSSGREGSSTVELAEEGHIPSSRLVPVGSVLNGRAADVEDLFDTGDYVKLVNLAFGKKLTAAKLTGRDRTVARVTRAIGEYPRVAPAQALVRNADSVLPTLRPKTLANFEALFQRLNNTLPVR